MTCRRLIIREGITFARWFNESISTSPNDMSVYPVWQQECRSIKFFCNYLHKLNGIPYAWKSGTHCAWMNLNLQS